MAQELDDGQFWLPPEFLNDEDILMDFKPGKTNSGDVFNRGCSGLNSYGFGSNRPNSDLSSPVESVVGSTETESDEEDYLKGLTQKLVHSTLEDENWKSEHTLSFETNNYKSARVVAGSPQSTLCGCKQTSSIGSPNCPSPPDTGPPLNQNEAAWDLLYAAAGEVARMKLAEEAASRYYNQNRSYVDPQQARKNPRLNLHYHQLQASQFQQLKQQQMVKQQQYQQMMQQNIARNGGNIKPVALPPSVWPTLQQTQQPTGSGMRAVFLGNPNTKRECTGTGVFLPRQIGAPTEPRKKRGCSTVLLPDRVVQALNLKLESQSQSKSRPHNPDYEAELKYRNSVLMADQRRNNVRQQTVMNEVRLPQEWTY